MAFGEALPAIAALSERAQEALGQESAYSLGHKFVCQGKKNCDAGEFVQFTKISRLKVVWDTTDTAI